LPTVPVVDSLNGKTAQKRLRSKTAKSRD